MSSSPVLCCLPSANMQIHDGIRMGSIRMGLRLRAVSRFLENCGEIRKTTQNKRRSVPVTVTDMQRAAHATRGSRHRRSHVTLRVALALLLAGFAFRVVCKYNRVVFIYNCADQSRLHIFLRSSNIWSFVYSFVFFIIYGYITNSQLWLRSSSLDSSIGRALHRYCRIPFRDIFQALTAVINHGLIGLHTFLCTLMYDLLHAYLFVWESLFVFPSVYLSLS